MAPETQEQQIERALKQINQKTRLKGAPTYHLYEIGKFKRELYYALDAVVSLIDRKKIEEERLTEAEKTAFKQIYEIFADPDVNPYSAILYAEDAHSSQKTPLMINYGYGNKELILYNSKRTTDQISQHFHAIEWEEFRNETDWELMREVIPAMQVASPRLKIYEEQRWLYDERSQRAAETLSYRISRIYPEGKLPEKIPLDDEQHRMMEEYESKLRKGGNPRRWFQEMKAKLSKT